MSGTTFNEECPNCGFDMESYSDWKPVSLVLHECYKCGWWSYPKFGQFSLDELNTKREDYSEMNDYAESDEGFLKSLSELPDCETDPF